jgi:hypothetical protein
MYGYTLRNHSMLFTVNVHRVAAAREEPGEAPGISGRPSPTADAPYRERDVQSFHSRYH